MTCTPSARWTSHTATRSGPASSDSILAALDTGGWDHRPGHNMHNCDSIVTIVTSGHYCDYCDCSVTNVTAFLLAGTTAVRWLLRQVKLGTY